MKPILTILFAAAVFLGAADTAGAVDFKAQGDWQLGVMGVANPTFDSDDKVDEFMATTRLRTTLEFIAQENLKGVMRINSGDRTWGADGLAREEESLELDRAYLDFMVPYSLVNIQAGKQGAALPSTLGSHILDDEIWGVSLDSPVTPWLGVTLGWGRADHLAYRDANNGEEEDFPFKDRNDEVDYFYGVLPVSLTGIEVTPFAAGGIKSAGAYHETDFQYLEDESRQSSTVYWAGVNLSAKIYQSLWIQADFNYGEHSSNVSGDVVGEESQGWIAALNAEYRADRATPEVFAMYESGHDDDFQGKGGEERGGVMPSISGDLWGVSTFGMSGSPLRGMGRAALDEYAGISAFGPSGKLALGGRLKEMSSFEDVTHELQLTYYQGTNHKDLRGLETNGQDDFFTTRDTAWEVTLDTHYSMYENLTAIMELGYLEPSMSSGGDRDNGPEDDAAWKAATGLRYEF